MIPPREILERILQLAMNAPSGSNSQPWRFIVRKEYVEVEAQPQKDHPLLNYRNRGTLVANGAVIENICISASACGYKSKCAFFPDSSSATIVARIRFEENSNEPDILFDSLPKRATNRNPYRETQLDVQLIAQLQKTCKNLKGEVRFIDDRKKIEVVSEAASVNERILFENKELHKLLFDEIVWNEQDERKKKSGLFLKTMGLKHSQEIALHLLRHWPLMKIANFFGASRLIAADNQTIYASSPQLGIIIVEDSDEGFVEAGRILERTWLTAVSFGCSLHLMTGILFFHQRMTSGDVACFSSSQVSMVNTAYGSISKAFEITKNIPALLFRIGYANVPRAFSSKKNPEIIYE